MTGRPRRPLDHVRVVDLTTAWAGPRLTAYLAELGADVIHVESIQYLDAHRGWTKWGGGAIGLHPNGEFGAKPWERSSLFVALNRGKRGITLNLGDERGRALFGRLLAVSDIFVENYRAGQLARFGFDEARLRQVSPDLIVVSLPAFGASGPYRDYTAWGDQASAITGLGALLRYPDEEEPEVGGTYGDPIAAAAGALAAMAALRHRDATGEGQTIEVPLTEGLIQLLAEPMLEQQFTGQSPAIYGSKHPSFAPWGLYRCAGDDQWVAICVEDDATFGQLAAAIGQPGLRADPRFAAIPDRLRHRGAIDTIVEGWTSRIGPWEAADRLQSAGVPAEPVQEMGQLFRDRQLIARGFFVHVEHPEAGTYPYTGPVAHSSGDLTHITSPAPTVGQHNREVLGGLLGLSDADLDALTAAKVIGDEPLEDDERRG